ncbi:MAG TPA: hypothetical protein VLH56_00015 [Dissulfurispiraceae bacterium]|nr:hypothetical protein [Dissulfurispiraceae bacterium]
MKRLVCLVFAIIIASSFIAWADAPAVTVTPPSGQPGAELKITGKGFKAGEEVDIILTLDPDTRVGLGTEKVDMVAADATGAFDVKSAFPAFAKPGKYQVAVHGAKGSHVETSIEVLPKQK